MSVRLSVRLSRREEEYVWVVRYLGSIEPLVASYEVFEDADGALDFALTLRDRGVQAEVVGAPLSRVGAAAPEPNIAEELTA